MNTVKHRSVPRGWAPAFTLFSAASTDGLLIVDGSGRFLEVNQEYCDMIGFSRNELLEMHLVDVEAMQPADRIFRTMEKLRAIGKGRFFSVHRHRDGRLINVEVSVSCQSIERETFFVVFIRNIRDREEEIWRDLTRNSLLELFALKSTMNEYLTAVVDLLKSWSDSQSVGIRLLDEDGNMPFVASIGFSEEFLEAENALSAANGACLCMRAVKGMLFEEEKSLLTVEGVCSCDNIARYIEGLSDDERRRYRSCCADEGYASLAIIPLCHQGVMLGAILIADPREGRLTLKETTFMHSIAPIVAEAVSRFSVEAELQNNFESQKTINAILQLTINSLSLDEILDKSLAYILDMPWLARNASGCIFLKEGESGEFRLKAYRNLNEGAAPACDAVRRDGCLCKTAIDTREVQFVGSRGDDASASCFADGDGDHYCIPIVSSGETMGLVVINIRRNYHPKKSNNIYLTSIANTLTGIIMRKRREKELQTERLKLGKILASMNDGVVMVDRSGMINYLNPVMQRDFGDGMGRPYDLFLTGESEGAVWGVDAKPGDGGPIRLEWKSPRNGRVYDIYSTVIQEDDEHSRVDFFHDVTESMMRDAEIRRQADLLARVNDAIISFDERLRITYWNDAAEMLYGWTKAEAAGQSVIELLHPEEYGRDRDAFVEECERCDSRGEFVHHRKDGSIINIEASIIALRQADGTGDGFVMVIRDITQRKADEAEMNKLTMAVEQSSDWVFITDRNGTIEYSNRIVERISGYSKAEIIGKNPRMMKSGKHDEAFYRNLWDTVLSGNTFRSIFVNRKKNGELFYLDNSITPLTDRQGVVTHFIASGKDITRQKQMEDQLVSLIHYDMLTGLPNRTLFLDRLNLAMSRAEYQDRLIAVLVIDLDKFQIMNDTFGPDIGDEILKNVARRLEGLIRDGDIPARLGGDEFGLALVDVAHKEDFILIVEKIRMAVSQPMMIQGHDIVVTVSIGISIYPYDGNNAFSIMHNAGIAISRLRFMGSNNYQFYTADMNLKASEFIHIEQQLFSAVKNNNRDFIIYFQPYYDIATRRLVGMESLLRWDNGSTALVLPDNFIPILEETGMINAVGYWIIEAVCARLREWIDRGYPVVPISINISPVQFRQQNLVDTLEKIIAASGIDPSLLVFELTENMLMDDIAHASGVLKRFREIGFAISIDDFGMGYSSLSYLKQFPLNNLKIDKSFIKDINTDPNSGSIVSAVISVAHSLNLKAIAEGVETEEQFGILRILRCDMIQGYLLSRPVPADDIEDLYRALAATPDR